MPTPMTSAVRLNSAKGRVMVANAPRHPGQVLPNVVVQIQLPLVSEESYCGSSELLGHGAHVKNGGRRNRDVPIQVGVPVALLVNELAAACNTDRASY